MVVLFSFQGKRCFYWLNRSFEVPNENSLLHFDVEWYTPLRDPKAAEKLDRICNIVNSALPSPVKILRENLSRSVPDNSFKNSYHLYALVTLEHNAQGCMKSFVTNNIWPHLKDQQDMWCGKSKRPIIDFSIYSKNQAFRVPGSSKYENYHPLPLPTLQFFMISRMADRRTQPDIRTSQLTLRTLPVYPSLSRSFQCKRSLVNQENIFDESAAISGLNRTTNDKKTTNVHRNFKRRRVVPTSFPYI